MQTEEVSMKVAMTMQDACQAWGIHPTLVKNLEDDGIKEFFEIQTKAIPQILDCDRCHIARDITICAPTGSGKTLVYIIPIVQALIHRIVPCIRALVVVPSRDLAIQAKATFDQYVKGTDLRVGMLGSWGTADSSLDYHDDDTWLRECNEEEDLLGTYEEVDIAITTPGRLVEHIKNNLQFDIQNLQYLIVDEADKLLLQSFSNWIHVLYGKLEETPVSVFEKTQDVYRIRPSFNRTASDNGSLRVLQGVRKILLSATLNSESNINIEKLRLNNLLVYTAKSVTAQNVFMVPAQLREHYYVCEAIRKPLVFLQLLRSLLDAGKKTLVFCNSIDTVHRVFSLTSLFLGEGASVAEYSSQIPAAKREAVMGAFQKGELRALISSDNIARGVDIPDVGVVVNYDIPPYTETYIHRSGRTARAMKEGDVVSLVRPQQEGFFRFMTKKIQGSHAKKEEMEKASEEMEKKYVEAIGQLKEVMMSEKLRKR